MKVIPATRTSNLNRWVDGRPVRRDETVMVRITIGQAMASRREYPHRLYRIRHSSGIVMYVGQTFDGPVSRLQRHMDGPLFASSVGRCILKNQPGSNSWYLEMLTLADCDKAVSKLSYAFKNWRADPQDIRGSVNIAESALIQKHNPCFNIMLACTLIHPADCQVCRPTLTLTAKQRRARRILDRIRENLG